MIPKQIKDTFKIGERIGGGSFGEVYKAKMKDGREVAIKFEEKTKADCLQYEIAIYKKMKGIPGFPTSIGNGSTSHHRFLAVELLGPSLMTVFSSHHKFFSLPTVLKIGVEMLNRLGKLHAKNIVHGDLKADNIVLGYNDPSTLYVIDFGLSSEIQNADTLREPIRKSTAKGTLKYMSIGAHQGIVSFQNDIESLAYLLVFLNRAQLPWELGKNTNNFNGLDKKAVYAKVMQMKKINQ